MTYTSYDIEGIKQMTLAELEGFYEQFVDHSIYPEFPGWLWDMLRSATIYERKES